MEMTDMDFDISTLGTCRISTRMSGVRFIDDDERAIYHSTLGELTTHQTAGGVPLSFEMAGPREKIYYDPSKLRCGIVTCGGICPGLNDVIRAIVLSLFHHYGVKTVFGFQFGYEGLSSSGGHPPIELNPEEVEDIHQKGGTILGSSRGPQDVSDMVENLERMNVGILFTIGGDGTLRGAQAISEEIANRNLKISVIGIPKTIDNDISFMHKSFGFETAVAESRSAVYGAHVEAIGAKNGIGLVKLMGRHSGFIAANATLANSEVNFCLVPEVDFTLPAFLEALRERLERRKHAVIVAAEGAGQNLMENRDEYDPSGNIKLNDIGSFLKNRIELYLKEKGMSSTLKYIDPSYMIRSTPANPHDSVFCLLLGHNAVHAGMAGRTNMVVGYWNGEYTHVPIPLAVRERKQIDPKGRLWSSVLASTGQPEDMR
ncbi:ATP-dependent 6-phosphofructokinase [Thermodesulfobacteriota bacterium]